jgi:hypothetical protein
MGKTKPSLAAFLEANCKSVTVVTPAALEHLREMAEFRKRTGRALSRSKLMDFFRDVHGIHSRSVLYDAAKKAGIQPWWVR